MECHQLQSQEKKLFFCFFFAIAVGKKMALFSCLSGKITERRLTPKIPIIDVNSQAKLDL
jgi:hypothetical protein